MEQSKQAKSKRQPDPSGRDFGHKKRKKHLVMPVNISRAPASLRQGYGRQVGALRARPAVGFRVFRGQDSLSLARILQDGQTKSAKTNGLLLRLLWLRHYLIPNDAVERGSPFGK